MLQGIALELRNVVFRCIIYFFIAFFVLMILGIIIDGSNLELPIFLDWGLISVPFLLPWFIESRVLKFRKEFGFSKWSGIVDEYHQRIAENRTVNDSKKTSVDGKGLDYWFDMKEKGAISEDEYEVIKKEILSGKKK